MGVAERRQREREERRVAILDAAEEVFLSKGVESATMDEIARRAELSKGALYLYFKSKEELYLGIATRALTLLHGRLEAAGQGAGSGFARTEALLRAQADFAQEYPRRFRVSVSWVTSAFVVQGEGPAFEEYRSCVGRVFRGVVAAISEGQADGSIRSDREPAQLAVQLFGGTLGNLLLFLRRDELARRVPAPIDLGDMVGQFLDLMLDGIRPADHERSAVKERSA